MYIVLFIHLLTTGLRKVKCITLQTMICAASWSTVIMRVNNIVSTISFNIWNILDSRVPTILHFSVITIVF